MAKDHTNYYRVKCSAYAELDGEQVDITGFETTYALDSIPTIKVWPTLGRDPVNDKEAAAVDKFLNAKQYTSLKVYAKFETELDSPDGGEHPGFPYDEDVLIFDGYVMASNYVTSRSPAGGNMQLECTGANWLTGLAGTDAQTVGTTIKGPAGWDELANPILKDAGVGLFDIQSAITGDVVNAVINLWVDYIKKIFLTIVDDDSIWGALPNESARLALGKMDDAETFGTKATNRLKLAYGKVSLDEEFLANFLAQHIGKILFSAWRHKGASIWQVLRACAQTFHFHIVPLIETASCCPVYGALSGDPYVTIAADDYSAVNLRSDVALMITKYALIGGQDTYSVPWSNTPREGGLIGLYSLNASVQHEGDKVNGQSIVAQVPMWIAAESEIGLIARDSLGGEQFGIPDASNPGAFIGEPEKDYQQLWNEVRRSELGNNFAKAVLQETNLAPRAGGLGGRFRLDICPGSTVRFEVIDDKFADSEAEPKYMFALVESVTLRLESGRAGPVGSATTAFGLTHVRTEEEQGKSYLTNQVHPLWGVVGGGKFLGAKLWKE